MLAAMAGAAVAGPFEDAFRGDAAAQLKVGDMYADGDGVPEDYGEAVKWYRLAADQGHAPASFILDLRYDTGLGVPKDHDEPAKWYRKAADRDYGIASAALKLHPSSPVLDALTHVRRHYIDLLLELHFQGREARRDCPSSTLGGRPVLTLISLIQGYVHAPGGPGSAPASALRAARRLARCSGFGLPRLPAAAGTAQPLGRRAQECWQIRHAERDRTCGRPRTPHGIMEARPYVCGR